MNFKVLWLAVLGSALFPSLGWAESSKALLQVSATVVSKCIISSSDTPKSGGVAVRCTKGTPIPESFTGLNGPQGGNDRSRPGIPRSIGQAQQNASVGPGGLALNGGTFTQRGRDNSLILSLDF